MMKQLAICNFVIEKNYISGHSGHQNLFLICIWSSFMIHGPQLPRPLAFPKQKNNGGKFCPDILSPVLSFWNDIRMIKGRWVSLLVRSPFPPLGLR